MEDRVDLTVGGGPGVANIGVIGSFNPDPTKCASRSKHWSMFLRNPSWGINDIRDSGTFSMSIFNCFSWASSSEVSPWWEWANKSCIYAPSNECFITSVAILTVVVRLNHLPPSHTIAVSRTPLLPRVFIVACIFSSCSRIWLFSSRNAEVFCSVDLRRSRSFSFSSFNRFISWNRWIEGHVGSVLLVSSIGGDYLSKKYR